MNRSTIIATLALAVAAACAVAAAPRRTNPPLAADTTGPAAACEAHEALDRMDTRSAVPLLPMMAHHQRQNMRDHLLAVQEIVLAASTDDFAAVGRAAGRIGYSEEMGQMCSHMGAGAPGFTDQALGFHRAADGIAAAAKKRDRRGVLTALGATLQTCTSCHATWKQQIVDEPSWRRLTSTPPPAGPAPNRD